MFSLSIYKKRIALVAGVLLITGGVAGCGASSAEKTMELTQEEQVASISGISVDFIVPDQIPNILVNQAGFLPESDKVAVFRGKELPETFQIRDLETQQIVYTGEIVKPFFDETTKMYYGNGSFNDFKQEGKYYIYADFLGESYSFSISEDVFRDVFTEACKKYYLNRCGMAISQTDDENSGHSACHTTQAHIQDNPEIALDVTGGWHMDEQADRDTLTGSRIVDNLLLSYELNARAFNDDTGIPESNNGIPDIIDEVKYEVDWLLKMQDTKTGGVYGAAVTDNKQATDIFSAPVEVTPVSMEATIDFAATMARFSYIYQQYDSEFATTALRAADRAWESFLNNQKAEDNTASFKAAAQLYRATGDAKYLEVMDKFFDRNDFKSLFNSDDNIFTGVITYLSTNQPVDKEKCNVMIKELMHRSEKIAQNAANATFKVGDSSTDDGFTNILEDMRCLTITNYIIYNHEYTTIIENHVNFMMGMNPKAVNYVTTGTERTFQSDDMNNGIMNNPQKNALLIFMLSVLT